MCVWDFYCVYLLLELYWFVGDLICKIFYLEKVLFFFIEFDFFVGGLCFLFVV